MAKRIVLCADDYGIAPGVSRGIRELLAAGRLSATSCMVVYPEFAEDGPLLRSFLGRADIGLHFTLTDKRSLASVTAQMHLRPPPISEIAAKLERQVRRFSDVLGRVPEFIDGHQHVHILPVVRDAVVQVARRIGAYVRVTNEPIDASMWRRPSPVSSVYLSRASRRLAERAAQIGVTTNHGFRGVRNFHERTPFGALFRSMIADTRDGCLIMCHPGHPDALLAGRDPVQAQRAAELDYLAGRDFLQDITEAGVVLSRRGEVIRAHPAAA